MANARHKKPKQWQLILAIIGIIVGIGAMLYPVAATLIINHSQQVAAEKAINSGKQLPEDDRRAQLEKARAYNKRLRNGPILDPFLQRVAPDTPLYRDYLTYLNNNGIMAVIEIPKIGVKLPILHGTDDAVLDKAAGHLFGSSLPVGGKNTHAVITAHSGLGNATMFDDLPKLVVGDEFYVHVLGETLQYQVKNTEVVTPQETSSLLVQPKKDLVTLITCTPYGINTHRLLVHGERVTNQPVKPDQLQHATRYTPWRWWMLIPIGVTSGVLALVTRPIITKLRKKAEAKKRKHRAS